MEGICIPVALSYDDSSRVGNETLPGRSRLRLDSILIVVVPPNISATVAISLFLLPPFSLSIDRFPTVSCKVLTSRGKADGILMKKDRNALSFLGEFIREVVLCVKGGKMENREARERKCVRVCVCVCEATRDLR